MTLIEIMVVIFLIGIISAVVGYNMKGSLEKGKRFKTEQAARQVREILLWEYANRSDLSLKNLKNYKEILENSSLVKKVEDIAKDGWGNDFEIILHEEEDDIEVVSPKLIKEQEKNEKKSV